MRWTKSGYARAHVPCTKNVALTRSASRTSRVRTKLPIGSVVGRSGCSVSTVRATLIASQCRALRARASRRRVARSGPGADPVRVVLKNGRDERVVRRDDRVVKISGWSWDLENQYLWLRHFAGLECVPHARSFSRHGRFGVLVLDFVEGQALHHEVARAPEMALPMMGALVEALSTLRSRSVGDAAPLTREV